MPYETSDIDQQCKAGAVTVLAKFERSVGAFDHCGDGGLETARFDEKAFKIRLKTGKPRENTFDDSSRIMIDIKSSPDYLNRSTGGSFGNFSMLLAGNYNSV